MFVSLTVILSQKKIVKVEKEMYYLLHYSFLINTDIFRMSIKQLEIVFTMGTISSKHPEVIRMFEST